MKTFIDLFCGIGGFRYAAEQAFLSRGLESKCVFSSDIDKAAAIQYSANFGDHPSGDITKIDVEKIPDHDLLLAGFPCQPFSIMGDSKGFEDTRGTLFFDIARILESKRPRAFVLENVKRLASHDGGRTLSRILETIDNLGYSHSHRILNALNFGLPQKRERLIIVGFSRPSTFSWPLNPIKMAELNTILEDEVSQEYYASEYIRSRRMLHCEKTDFPTIWHENKSGHISALPYSCALRAGASYNYLLVNGERRLTPREMLRLQGFPESFRIIGNYGDIRKQAGNSVPVPMIRSVIERVIDAVQSDNNTNILNKSCTRTTQLTIDQLYERTETSYS
jgi:DNA (cytosine-5)-methyltransferase 1